MANIPVDLRTVTRVRIGNQWTDIEPGSLTVGRAQLRMTGGPDIIPGGLTYFFTDTHGFQHDGPYEHIQQRQHTTEENPS